VFDGEIKYSFRELLNDCWFAPYIGVGGGYTWVDNIRIMHLVTSSKTLYIG
jgi:hypothetical protein